MTAATRPGAAHGARVSSGSALVLMGAALAVAGLVAVGVGGLLPAPDVGARRYRTVEADVAAPAAPAPVPGLADRAPAAAFDQPAPALPVLASGPFEEVAGSWRVGDEGAEARPAGRAPTLAVAPGPDGTTVVGVTLAVARPGAGVVTSWTAPDRYLSLEVDASGRNLSLTRVDPDQAAVLLRAPVAAPGRPLVLALRRVDDRVEAIANGVVLGARVVADPGPGARVGLVAGAGRSGERTRFRDLVLA